MENHRHGIVAGIEKDLIEHKSDEPFSYGSLSIAVISIIQ